MSFCSVIGAMKAVPAAWWRGVYQGGGEERKMEVKMGRNARRYAPLQSYEAVCSSFSKA